MQFHTYGIKMTGIHLAIANFELIQSIIYKTLFVSQICRFIENVGIICLVVNPSSLNHGFVSNNLNNVNF